MKDTFNQHRTAMCAIASITVTAPTTALWFNHRVKHISSRGPYLSSRKAANSALLLSPYKSRSSLHLWNDALIFILVFSLAQSSSLFSRCFSSSVFLFLLFYMGNGGAFSGSVVVVVCSVLGSDRLYLAGSGRFFENYSHWVEPQTVDFYTADLITSYFTLRS